MMSLVQTALNVKEVEKKQMDNGNPALLFSPRVLVNPPVILVWDILLFNTLVHHT